MQPPPLGCQATGPCWLLAPAATARSAALLTAAEGVLPAALQAWYAISQGAPAFLNPFLNL